MSVLLICLLLQQRCAMCEVDMEDDPALHIYECHTEKTSCYECPWCAHCEMSKPKFVEHVSHHPGYDKEQFSAMQFFVNGLPPFTTLPQCLKCEHRGLSIAALAEHCHEFHTDKPTSSSRPLVGMTVFPYADVPLREELDNMQNELATMVLEATKLKNERKRRQLHPECYGVAHLVSLRGDVVTCAADPYAHVYIEHMIQDGDYILRNDNSSMELTVRKHHACPALAKHQQHPQDENPRGFKLSGLFHLARGSPVVWFVVSFADMPAKGEWLITTSKGEHVSKLTVDLERVFM